MLVTLSVVTSIDALAVGLSMAFLRVSVWVPSVVIGLVAAAFSGVVITFGNRFGRRCGRWAEALSLLAQVGTDDEPAHLRTQPSTARYVPTRWSAQQQPAPAPIRCRSRSLLFVEPG